MHRVDTKKGRAAALRIVAYITTLTLTAITTIVLLFIALGYRFDQKSGHVVRSGLLLVDNRSEAGAIYINNQLKDNATPGRFVLRAGSYDLRISRENYREWKNTVAIKPSGVLEVTYPLLVPNTLNPRTLKNIEAPYLTSQSPDKKRLLVHAAGQTALTLTTLNPESVEDTELILPATIARESGNIGTFRVIEWSLNNKHVLLEQMLPSGAIQIISLDVGKPEEAVNISKIYGTETPSDIHYVGSDTDKIYGVKNNILSTYEVTENKSEAVIRNIRSYQPYGNDTILFDRLTSAGIAEVGIWEDGAATVIHTNVEGALPSLLKLAQFDDHTFFVVAPMGGNTVTIYRDPLKKPILAKQIPFTTLTLSGATKIDFSDSAQFLLVQSGSQLLTYDFEDLKTHSIIPGFEFESNMPAAWLDSHHLQLKRSDGMTFITDFDGSNRQELITTLTGSRLVFAGNFETAYRYVSENNSTELQLVPFIAP